MADLSITLTPGDEFLARFAAMVDGLAGGKLRTAEQRALNHVGAVAFTAVKRALVQQTSLPRTVVEQGVTTTKGSRTTELEFRIVGTGNRLPLRLFGPSQFSYGVRAKIWGRFQKYPHVFMLTSGNVYKRPPGGGRGPLVKLWGPGVASEIIKDQAEKAFEVAAKDLPPRLLHEISFLLRV